jgi:superfamily II DNA/RNA helicase
MWQIILGIDPDAKRRQLAQADNRRSMSQLQDAPVASPADPATRDAAPVISAADGTAAPDTETEPSLRFSAVGLSPLLQRAVADQGYTTMTPIQAKAIPIVLAGRDVMGAAQTGTGKTAAFSLPLLHRMLAHENASMSPARHPVRALVITPTRELADQVADNITGYAAHSKLRVAVVFGGIDMKPQTLQLKKGVEVLVATPGRLLDHIEAKNCVLNQVEYVVLDEADRMLDIGFLPDLQRILSYLPKQRQTLLFSATFSPEIKRLAESYLQTPCSSRWRARTRPPRPSSSTSTASPSRTSGAPCCTSSSRVRSTRRSSSSTRRSAARGSPARSSATG